MPDSHHAKLAADTWRLICALGEIDSRDEEFHDAARNIIEIACDSAVTINTVVLAEARRMHAEGATHECSEWPTLAGTCAVCGQRL